MSSTYSTNLAIELIGTGDQAGVWGNTTNTNLGTLIEQAISGYVTQAVATGTDTTITIPNGATGVARNMYIELTGTGGASTNLIVPANKKLYFIFNNSTGAVTVKVSGQTGVSVPNGQKMVLVCNGTDVVTAVTYAASMSVGSLTLPNGAANGVAYLNASKVVTAGSALTFDGVQTLSVFGTGNSVLHLEGSTTNNGVMRFRNGTTGALSGLVGNNSKDLIFEANGATERMRLDAAGNLGLGVTPSAWGSSERSLDIGNTGSILRASNAALGVVFNAFINASSQYIYKISSFASLYEQLAGQHRWYNAPSGTAGNTISFTQAMTLDASGNLGIGTTSPSNTALFSRQVQIDGTTACLTLNGTTGGGKFSLGVPSVNACGLWDNTASTYRWFVDSSGNLGIGTTTINYRAVADCNGAGNNDNGFAVRNTNSSAYGGSYNFEHAVTGGNSPVRASFISSEGGSGNSFMRFATTISGTLAERMRIDSSGNLGIGTASPSQRLDVTGAIRSANSGSVNILVNDGSTTSSIQQATNTLFFNVNGDTGVNGSFAWRSGNSFAERMRLDSSGNLGIGTASPATKVEVYGGASGTATNLTVGNANTAFVFGVDTGDNCQIRTAQNVPMIFYTNATNRGGVDGAGNWTLGGGTLATTATDGFLYVPTCAGTPTGTPTTKTGFAPIVVNTTNNKLYFYSGGAWRDAGP